MRVFRSVQYLRAIAALMVVLHHVLTPADGIWLPMQGGAFLASGVDIFFVISGFIIYTSQVSRTDGALPFLRRRFIRVVPLYWAVTLVLIALHLTTGIARDLSLAPSHVAASFLLVPHYSPSQPDHLWPLLIPGWSLVYEAFFYVAYAAAIALAPRREAPVLAIVLLGLVALGVVLRPSGAIGVAYTSPLLLEFLSGMGLAAVVRRVSLPAALVVLAPIGLMMLAIADVAVIPRIVGWGVPSLLIVLGFVAFEARTPASRLMAIGDGSYSIYLTHPITLSLVRGVWRHSGIPGAAGAVAFVILAMAISIAVGLVVHQLLEKPLLGLARSRSARRGREPETARPVVAVTQAAE